jgi:hypothetical protein
MGCHCIQRGVEMTRKEAPFNITYRGHRYEWTSFYVTKEDAVTVQKRLIKKGGNVVVRKYPLEEYQYPRLAVTETGRPESVKGKAFYGVYLRGGYNALHR